MSFGSMVFLFGFLPAVLVCYFLLPARWRTGRNTVLLIFSLAFYCWGGVALLPALLVSCVGNWAAALWAAPGHRGRKAVYGIALAGNLVMLGYFKYTGFLLENLQALGLDVTVPSIALPAGISFFTFQAMAYLTDVYRGTIPAERSLPRLTLFMAFFPQLLQGPILRYGEFAPALTQRRENSEDAAAGATRFCFGLAKKVLLADSLGVIADAAFSSGDRLTMSLAWLGGIAYTLQLYFDFSGYTDMAIGLGRIFGFRLPENFNYPYISKSASEFWRRWHMTLSFWFRDYVYIPLGGNRCSRARQIRNILTVWLLTGLWHGAAWTFILWGLWFCLLLLGEKFLWGHFLEQLPSPIRWACTMLAVILSWVLFRAADLGQAWAYLGAMFGQTTSLAQDGQAVYYLLQFWPEWILALIAFLPVKQWLQSWLEARGAAGQTLALWAPRVLALGLLVLSYGLLVTGSFNPFIYFQF